MSAAASRAGLPERLALRSAAFAERWFPDAWVFAVVGVLFAGEAVHTLDIVGMAVILSGVATITLAKSRR